MWVFHRLGDFDIVQLDVEVLVHTLERASNGDVILQLHSDLVIDERLEEAKEEHFQGVRKRVLGSDR